VVTAPVARRRRLSLVLVGIIATAGVLLAHEGHAPLPTSGTQVDLVKGTVALSPEARAALDVGTADVGTDPPPVSILSYASLEATWQKHAFASSRLAGQISALHVRPGETVAPGAVLAEVKSPELEQLRLDALSARTAARQSELVLKGLRESTGVVSGQDVADAEVKHQQDRISMEVATAKWTALGLPEAELFDDRAAAPALPVRAPVGGTVIHADVAVGKVVEPGEHLFEVVDLSTVWARIGILEQDLGKVSAGQPVALRLTALPGETFRGVVEVVGTGLDPATHLGTAWAEFANPPGAEPRFLPGMSGQARLELPTPTGAKVVAAEALVNDGVDRFVFVEAASAAGMSEYQKKSVVVLREAGGAAVIRSADLYPGDRVVTRGSHELGGLFAPGVVRLSPEAGQTLGLETAPVGRRGIDDVVTVPGAVDVPPDRRAAISSPLPGTLVALRVDRAGRLEPGQVLGEVFSLEFQSLQLDLLKETLSADLLGRQLGQLRALADNVSRRRVIDLEAAHSAATNRRDSLRRRLAVLGLTAAQLEELVTRRRIVPTVPVRATISGTLVGFGRVLGQAVRADEALFEVHDGSRPWVQAFVSEADLPRVRLGQRVRVRLASAPAEVFGGKITRSGRTLAERDRTLSVWVELDSAPKAPLRHGQMARVTLVTGSSPSVPAVPVAAVAQEGTRAFVFIRTPEGTFDRRAVQAGRSDDRHIEIRSGVSEGEVIAVTAAAELQTAYASVR
jgi:membrane fusion protein, heavy metal efflux system